MTLSSFYLSSFKFMNISLKLYPLNRSYDRQTNNTRNSFLLVTALSNLMDLTWSQVCLDILRILQLHHRRRILCSIVIDDQQATIPQELVSTSRLIERLEKSGHVEWTKDFHPGKFQLHILKNWPEVKNNNH